MEILLLILKTSQSGHFWNPGHSLAETKKQSSMWRTTFIEIKRLDAKIPDSEKIIVTTHKNSEFLFLLQYCSERTFQDPGSRVQETILDAFYNIYFNKLSWVQWKKILSLEA